MTKPTALIRMIMELRSSGISDQAVLRAIELTPRELFVPENLRDQAYENTALPIGLGQTISQPVVVAYMTQELRIDRTMRVLEIGTGSGYQAAVLARLCRRVYTIERHRPLLAEAIRRFAALGLHNITTRGSDGSRGWPEQAPFDRIMLTCAVPEVPEILVAQLKIGGLMLLPLGPAGFDQNLVRITRTETGVASEELWGVRFVPLVTAGGQAQRR